MSENTEVSYSEQENTPSYLRRRLILFLLFIIIVLTATALTIPTMVNRTHKPAIYLYSDESVVVSLKLDNLLLKDIVIPNYSNGWSILVKKDGWLSDLKPEKTDCSKLPDGFGFEYAKEACRTNDYPYIYWDGTTFKKLPQKHLGWFVKKEDFEEFLNQKSDEMGMNKAEKSEFVRYWTYKTANYPANGFWVYFLQNEEVDKYIKLKVSPMPQSWNRVQIVITPESASKTSLPYPLKKITREGLTLVEWGGVIKKKAVK